MSSIILSENLREEIPEFQDNRVGREGLSNSPTPAWMRTSYGKIIKGKTKAKERKKKTKKKALPAPCLGSPCVILGGKRRRTRRKRRRRKKRRRRTRKKRGSRRRRRSRKKRGGRRRRRIRGGSKTKVLVGDAVAKNDAKGDDSSSKHKTKTKTGDIWKMSTGTNNELYAKTTDNPKA